MTEFARLPPAEKRPYFEQCAGRKQISPVVVEKDFWVCWMLARLFDLDGLGGHLVFKGGTSLSKVFGILQRFSEDIDLSISPELLGVSERELEEATKNQRVKRVKRLEEACCTQVKNVIQPALEASISQILGPASGGHPWLRFEEEQLTQSPVLLFDYPAFSSVAGYLQQQVKVEFGSLTDQQPVGSHPVAALLEEIAPKYFTDLKATVCVLELERTFWEKATILHAEYHRAPGQPLRDRYSRHYADFASLWAHPTGQAASQNHALLARVAWHKNLFFRTSSSSYDTAQPGTLRLVPPPSRVKALKADYDKMRMMYMVEPISFHDIMKVLDEAEATINQK